MIKINKMNLFQFAPLIIIPITVIAIILFIISNNIKDYKYNINKIKAEIFQQEMKLLQKDVNTVSLAIKYKQSIINKNLDQYEQNIIMYNALKNTYENDENKLFIIDYKNDILLNNIDNIDYKNFKQTYWALKDNINPNFNSSKLYKQKLDDKSTIYVFYKYINNNNLLIYSQIKKDQIKDIIIHKLNNLKLEYEMNFNKLLLISLAMVFIAIIIAFILSEFISESFNKYEVKLKENKYKLNKLVNSLENIIEDRTKKIIKQKDDLYFQANHDNLTKLPNRTLFHVTLEQAIKKAKRDNSGIALFFLDLDNFKQINDTLGHDFGDEILIQVANRITSRTRDVDTLCRLGGDEFTIVMENLKDSSDASVLAQKIINDLSKPFIIEGHTLYISCSIGISFYPDDDLLAVNLIKYADTAMYTAKEKGKSRFQYYSKDMTDAAHKKIALETSLRHAIEKNQFVVHYQAQVDSHSEAISGIEALIRWNHPSKGLIYPVEFMEIAKKNGTIIDIDNFVLDKAMRDVKSWYDMGYNPGVLSLNITMKHITNANFIDNLLKKIKEIGFKTKWLKFEITEEEMMKNPKKTIFILNKLHQEGIKIALDDFGTGYSSLSYLNDLPLDELKIDRSFVKNISSSASSKKIAKTIISLASSLDLNIIAEGVENKEQKDTLENMGCNNVQGHYYSKSCDAKLLKNILNAQNSSELCS